MSQSTYVYSKCYVCRRCISKSVMFKIEIKLTEFNFKVMYGILPCNSNLEDKGKLCL